MNRWPKKHGMNTALFAAPGIDAVSDRFSIDIASSHQE
jgi:hypothetical protein